MPSEAKLKHQQPNCLSNTLSTEKTTSPQQICPPLGPINVILFDFGMNMTIFGVWRHRTKENEGYTSRRLHSAARFGTSRGDAQPLVDMPRLALRIMGSTKTMTMTRLQVSTGVKWARDSGALPQPDPNDLEPPAPDPDDDDRLESEGKLKHSTVILLNLY